MKYFIFIIGNIALIFTIASALRSTERCGKNYDNQKCDSGDCCSKYGYCGTSEEHCSIDEGCQSEFGECKDYSSKNGRCGKNYDNQKCDSGECCSKYGYCGNSEEHCSIEEGCQSDFGECKDYSGDSKTTTIKAIGMINTGPGADCSTEMTIAFHSPYSENFVEYTEASDTTFTNAKKISVTGTYRDENRQFVDENGKSVTFYSCKAYLENLSPDTKYIYHVGNNKETSNVMNFKTAGTNGKFSFAWLADVHTASKSDTYRENIKTVLNRMKSIDFVMFSGDITDVGNQYHEWEYFSGNPSISNYMYATIAGNHDYYIRPKEDIKYISNKWFIDYAATPKTNTINDNKLDPSNYWFIYNKVLFINIDSTQNDSSKENEIDVSKQIKWFEDVVENAEGKYDYIIVQQHFSYLVDKEIKYGRFTKWSPIFLKYRVDLALGADSHEYYRSAPLYWTGTKTSQDTLTEDTVEVSEDLGTVYMTAFQLDGSGLSSGVKNKATFLKDLSFYAGGGKGACKIDITKERIKVSLITSDSDEADTVTINKKRR